MDRPMTTQDTAALNLCREKAREILLGLNFHPPHDIRAYDRIVSALTTLQADNQSLAERVEELDEKLMKARRELELSKGSVNNLLKLNERGGERAEAAEARLAEALKALEPFAKAAETKLCGEWQDDQRFAQTDVGFHLTFGHLRAARRVREGGQ